MLRSRSKLGFKRNSSLQENNNILSRVSTTSGVWINGSKELLRYVKHKFVVSKKRLKGNTWRFKFKYVLLVHTSQRGVSISQSNDAWGHSLNISMMKIGENWMQIGENQGFETPWSLNINHRQASALQFFSGFSGIYFFGYIYVKNIYMSYLEIIIRSMITTGYHLHRNPDKKTRL